jgi:hypothetical protein
LRLSCVTPYLAFSERDPRSLLSRLQLYELMSEVSFIHVFAVFNDFVYAPLTLENPLSAAQFQDGLPWQEVHHMAERLRPPEHAVVRDWVTVLQVAVTELLADRKGPDE